MLKSILVTGKNGQLGQSLQKVVIQNSELSIQHAFIFVGRDQLDLASPQSITDFFRSQRFDAIINCAAYTTVDKAESEPELADQINHLAVKQLADIAKALNSFLIHISTDYVFDGTNHRPYVETDKTNPINTYGLTKLKGEQAMQASGCAGAIIRTSWVYSEFGNNFVKTMLRLAKERDNLNVIYDQIGSPTYATDLAQVVLAVLNNEFSMLNDEDNSGEYEAVKIQNSELNIYHYANEGVCSWYDFAKAIFEISNINCQVNSIETQDYPTPAKRPFYSVMNKAKIKQQAGLVIPYWRDSLKQCLMQLEQN
ncbi:MAG: dTDP-4-dehydrorhamnose reductase [Methyloprofundus sp.]|nr:dTDP-4-dehydrorhamnose reductase [Methyloprofundus sp.]